VIVELRIPDFRGISMLTTRKQQRNKICFCIIFQLFSSFLLLSVCALDFFFCSTKRRTELHSLGEEKKVSLGPSESVRQLSGMATRGIIAF
jgi:hypothetical protein